MTKRIYKAICAAALGVFVVTMLLIMGVLYNYFSAPLGDGTGRPGRRGHGDGLF